MFEALLRPDLQVASSAIMWWLGEGLLFGTALAALTWLLIRLSGRRGHTGFEVAVWSIVLLKFLIPLGPGQLAVAGESLSDHDRPLTGEPGHR